MTGLAEGSRDVAVELHALFAELDRGRLRREAAEALEARLSSVRSRVSSLVRTSEPDPTAAPTPIASELRTLDALLDQPAPGARRSDWIALRQRVQPSYESLARALSAEDIHVPSLRPTNYARNVLHVASATSALLALELAPSWSVAIGIAATVAALGLSLEISRRVSPRVNDFCMWLFGRTAHPHEAYRVNSATWYAVAVLLLALAQSAVPAAIALVVLGVGDPIAAIVGRRWGRVRLVHGRSLEGTLAFAVSGGLAALGYVALLHPEVALGHAALAAACGAVVGAITELFSRRVDDNFSIPLAAFSAAYLALL